jgi:tetratricopeptide (TPR) repeat protein
MLLRARFLRPTIIGFAVAISAIAALAQSNAPVAALAPVTDSEGEAFGRQLERHFAAGDKGFYARAFNPNTVFDRAIAGHTAAPAELESYRADFKKQFNDFLFDRINQVGSLKFLRLKRARGESRLLCRIISTGKGLDYLEICVERGARGGLRLADSFDVLSGDSLSETFSRTHFAPLALKDKSLQQKLFRTRADLLTFYPEWSEMLSLNAQAKHKQALPIYHKLPASLQVERFILLDYIQEASDTDEDAYLEALDLWRRSYPNDPGTEILGIDEFMFRKKYAKALDCVDRLDKSIGGDAHLDYLRAEFFERLGDYDKSREAAQRVINREPQLLEPYFFLLASYSRKHQYPAGINILNRLWRASNLPKDKLVEIVEGGKDYSLLVKSAEYRKWRGTPTSQPASTVASTGKPPAASPPALKLQSIFYQPNRPGATLSGQFVLVGDKIKGHKVLAIDQQSVTLQCPDGQKQILTLNQ